MSYGFPPVPTKKKTTQLNPQTLLLSSASLIRNEWVTFGEGAKISLRLIIALTQKESAKQRKLIPATETRSFSFAAPAELYQFPCRVGRSTWAKEIIITFAISIGGRGEMKLITESEPDHNVQDVNKEPQATRKGTKHQSEDPFLVIICWLLPQKSPFDYYLTPSHSTYTPIVCGLNWLWATRERINIRIFAQWTEFP